MRIPNPNSVKKELRENIYLRLLTSTQIDVMLLLYDRELSPEAAAARLGMTLKEVLHHESKALYWMGFKQRKRQSTRGRETEYIGAKHKRQHTGDFHAETVELLRDLTHFFRCTGERDPAGNCLLAKNQYTFARICREALEVLGPGADPETIGELNRLRKFSLRYGDLTFEFDKPGTKIIRANDPDTGMLHYRRESDLFRLVLPRKPTPPSRRRKRRSTGQFRWKE